MSKMTILAPVEVLVVGVHCDTLCDFFGSKEPGGKITCTAFGEEKLKLNEVLNRYFRCQGCISGQLLMEKRALRALKMKEKKRVEK
jgi:hypothetical protein